MASEVELCVLSGQAGAGKDFIFEHYLKPLGYHRWALADHFKIGVIGQGRATYEEVFVTKPPHIRSLLQQEGTERGRHLYGDSVWLDTAWAWMRHLSSTWGIAKFCTTDARFVDEVEYLQARGAKVLRIIAPTRVAQSTLTPEARAHISETALDDYPLHKYAGVLYNDPEDPSEALRATIGTVLGFYVTDATLVYPVSEAPPTPEQRGLLGEMSRLSQELGEYR